MSHEKPPSSSKIWLIAYHDRILISVFRIFKFSFEEVIKRSTKCGNRSKLAYFIPAWCYRCFQNIGSQQKFQWNSQWFAEVQPDIVTVLADAAENVEEIDIARAEAARKRAEEALAKGIPPDSDAYLKIEDALRKSNLRLDAVKRFRRGPIKPTRITDETR